MRRNLMRMAGSLARIAALASISIPRAAAAQNPVHRLALVEDLRLDAEAEDFSALSRVILRLDGTVAVPLRQDMEVRVYDVNGRRMWSIGRSGSGPGEFRHLGALTWLADTLFVEDARLRRVTYIGPRGDLLRTRPLPPPIGAMRIGRAASDTTFRFFMANAGLPDGAVLGIASLNVGNLSDLAVSSTNVLLSLFEDGTARIIATPPQYLDDRWMITISGLSNPLPFALQPRIVFSADGSRFAFLTADQTERNGTYDVGVFEADGDTVFVRRFSFIGESIPQSAVDSAIAAMTPAPGEPREQGSDPRRFRAAARQRMPAVYAPVESLALGLDGTVWLTLRATEDGREAVVLDARGTPFARVALPAHSRIQQASSSHVWMTETDSLGLTNAVRYRILRPG